MTEEEIKTEKANKIVNLVEDILRFNKQHQEGKGIKILTPNQMLSRLPIRKTKKRNKAIIIFSLPFKKYNQASIQ